MMPTITEGQLTFEFRESWLATKFDDWSFYRNQFQKVCGGTKAVDILAINPNECFWIIEVKDYRQHQRTKSIDLGDEVATKVRDSLSALVAAKVNANDSKEQELASSALACIRMKVVLHLEQPIKHSKLYPRAIDPAKVMQRLKQLIKAIDPHPLVVEMGSRNGVSWTVKNYRKGSS